MPTDVNAALKEYGYVGTLANAVPELKRILLASAAKGATVEEFTRAVQDSKWWKNSADSMKAYQIQKATKPGEFQAQRGDTVAKVRRMAAQLGVGLGEGKGSQLGHIVDMAMQHGWDDATLQAQIGHQLQGATATFGGQAGTIQQQIKKLYGDYGLPSSSYTVNMQTRAILSGTSTLQTVQAGLMQSAKSKYANLAPQIDQGMTVRDIADPYVQSMASTLELPPAKVALTDPYIQKALTSRDDKGQPTTVPLWQFQDQLRQDPRYDHTTQAVNDAYSMVSQIGKSWGFSG
jgi:hypothetical protein